MGTEETATELVQISGFYDISLLASGFRVNFLAEVLNALKNYIFELNSNILLLLTAVTFNNKYLVGNQK